MRDLDEDDNEIFCYLKPFSLFDMTKITQANLEMPCLQPFAPSFTQVKLSLVCAIFLTAVSKLVNVMQKS